MASEPEQLQDEDYNSASDQDYNPDGPKPEVDDGESSSSDDNDEQPAAKTKKRKDVAEDLDFNNSGDEATISRAKRKKQKTGSKAKDEDDDEGGEGGLIKTRAQRRVEVQEKKPLVQAGKASVNVEDLWAQMSAPQTQLSAKTSNNDAGDAKDSVTAAIQEDSLSSPGNTLNLIRDPGTEDVLLPLPNDEQQAPAQESSTVEATITIKRTYEFAGQKMEEERIVPAASAEARLYLEEQSRKSSPGSTEAKPPLRRPKKRASMFDTAGGVAGNSLSGQLGKGHKLNTLEKSKLDWAAHVDQEGISDELDEHRRAKEGYLGRMDFLGRMDAKREDELRSIKPK